MTGQPPSIWSMDRESIEQTLVEGRSPRREYTEKDKAAIRAVLDQSGFDEMDEDARAAAFQRMHNSIANPDTIANRDEPPSEGASSMAITGWIVLILSVVLSAYAAFGYDTAIHSGADFVGGTFIPSRDTINIGLLQNQLMMFQAGLAGILSAVMLLAVNAVRSQ